MTKNEMIKYLEKEIEVAKEMANTVTSDMDYGTCAIRADHLFFEEGIYRGKITAYKEMLEILKGE